MSKSFLEIRSKKGFVVLWTPEASGKLNRAEASQLLDALGKMSNNELTVPSKVEFCKGMVQLTNYQKYIELGFFVQDADSLKYVENILEKSSLVQLIPGLERAIADTFQ